MRRSDVSEEKLLVEGHRRWRHPIEHVLRQRVAEFLWAPVRVSKEVKSLVRARRQGGRRELPARMRQLPQAHASERASAAGLHSDLALRAGAGRGIPSAC